MKQTIFLLILLLYSSQFFGEVLNKSFFISPVLYEGNQVGEVTFYPILKNIDQSEVKKEQLYAITKRYILDDMWPCLEKLSGHKETLTLKELSPCGVYYKLVQNYL